MNSPDYLSVFMRQTPSGADMGDRLQLPRWGEAEWRALLAETTPRPFKGSEVVIQHGVTDRSLYLVADGALEVGVTYIDGLSMSPIARIGIGSVIGEQSFFDSQPRSANVWAVSDGELLCLTPEKFEHFTTVQPALACDLLFALGRILSLRLRNTTFRVRK